MILRSILTSLLDAPRCSDSVGEGRPSSSPKQSADLLSCMYKHENTHTTTDIREHAHASTFDNVESKQQNENKFDKFVVPKWKYRGITLQRQSSFILEKAFTCTRHTCMPLRFMHSSLTLSLMDKENSSHA